MGSPNCEKCNEYRSQLAEMSFLLGMAVGLLHDVEVKHPNFNQRRDDLEAKVEKLLDKLP